MRIILVGPPGSGKAVISRKIAERYGVPVIGMEEVAEELSSMASEEDDIGRLARESIASGKVSDDVCNMVLKRLLAKDELASGYVLLGYPKDAAQAEVLYTAMRQAGRPLDLVLMIEIDRDELMERRVGRIDCDSCGAQYNLYVNPPMVEGVCDLCGGRLSRRPRGYEENIANQLREYDVGIQPVLDFFEQQGILRPVDGNGTEEQLWKNVREAIDSTTPAQVELLREQTVPAKKTRRAKQDKGKKPPTRKKSPVKKETARKAAVKKKAPDAEKSTAKQETSKPASKKKVVKKAAAKKRSASKKKVVKKVAATKKIAKKKTLKKAAKKKVSKKKTLKKAAKKKVSKKKATK